MKDFKVGLQLYTIRDDMDADMDAALGRVAEIGYEYVEFAGGYRGKSADEIKALLDKHGLKCNSVHQAPQMFIEQGQAAVDFFKTFGVKYAVIPHYPISKLAGSDEWDDTVKLFTELGALLRKNGMQLLYHNHDFEFNTFEDKYLIDHLFETVPDDLILPEFDTCWIKYGGEDPCKYIEKFAGKIEVLHLKDFYSTKLGCGEPVYALIDNEGKAQRKNNFTENDFHFRPLGHGIQDFNSILTSAEKAGIEYLIVEQDASEERPPIEAAKISREYLKSLGI